MTRIRTGIAVAGVAVLAAAATSATHAEAKMIIQDCTSYPGAVSVAGIPASTATLDVTAQRRAKGYSYLSSRATWDGSDPFTIAATSFWSSTMSCGNKFWVTALGGSGRVLATASFGR